jgi:hypothetical protein
VTAVRPDRSLQPSLAGVDVLEDLPLHDAVVESVSLDWTTGELHVVVSPVGPGELFVLSFRDVSSVEIPREMPWGRSSSINAARTVTPSGFELEMQSGDTWRIQAARWVYAGPVNHEVKPA